MQWICGWAFFIGVTVNAAAGLPLLKHLAEGHELPLPWGIGIDVFDMEQPYAIQELSFTIRNFDLPLPEGILVDNEVLHFDVKFDVWLLPFLNLFAIVGDLEGDTRVTIPQTLPIPIDLDVITVNYDGTVFGGGAVIAVGGKHWFANVTSSLTNTDLKGDFNSSVEALTLQPRIGYPHPRIQFWVGGMFLDAEEKHQGTIQIAPLGLVDFDVTLAEEEAWHYTAGANIPLTKQWQITLEGGFGNRDTLLGTFVFRF